MIENFIKVGQEIQECGAILVCTETKSHSCDGCHKQDMDVTCDDWHCSALHRPDKKSVIFVSKAMTINGVEVRKVPYVGCAKCCFANLDGDGRPCNECKDDSDFMYALTTLSTTPPKTL